MWGTVEMSKTVSLFRVVLEHGKYYVGESVDPVKRLEELREGLGPFWTQIHKPIRMEEVIPFQKPGEVDAYTKRSMRTYGIENVRGGAWESANLSDGERQALHNDLQKGCLIA